MRVRHDVGVMSSERIITMRKFIASLAAGGVLVAGAFVATTLSNGAAQAQEADDEVATETMAPEPGAVLTGVLDELVADGVITQSQADAVAEALAEKREELGVRPHVRRHFRHLIADVRALLADGVISADEIAELQDGHPFKNEDGPFAELLEDGQITQDEWDAFVEEHKAEREARREAGVGNAGTGTNA